MASNPSTKEWLCHIPDHPNKLEQRKAVRPDHLKDLKPHIDSRKVVLGGAFLNKHPEEGEGPDMLGSFIIVQADSKEEVMEFLRGDAYTKNGVWDLDSTVIYPFKSAFRTPVS